ncbi:MAG: homoserine O-acetyltransferase, partial [Candidatus Eiseniibacteriota bacterium]
MPVIDEHRDLWWPSPSVELARVVSLDLRAPFQTVYGGTIESIQVAYESWGELDATRSNAVLVVHPLAMDSHAATGGGSDGDRERGWWDDLIGPGRAIDTERSCVLCPNLIGGCYGTTGPRFPSPDGEPYLDRFPLLTPLDMMRVQQLFLRQLGIRHLAMVIGPSMGGMVAWEWAVEAGDTVGEVVVVAAPLRTTAYQIGLNWLQRRGIELDLGADEMARKWGQMIARGVGMLSYRSNLGLEEKFGRDWFKQPGSVLGDRGMYNVESWLRHHGRRSVKRFDPYTYILFTRAMDLHDVGEGRGGYVAALDRVRCPVRVVGISSDQLYSADEVKLGADVLTHLGREARYEEIRSPHGHDAWVLETEQLATFLGPERRAVRPAPAVAAEREVRRVRLGILGAGNVAAHVLGLLTDRADRYREELALEFEVAAVAEIDRQKRLRPVFEQVEVLYEPEALVRREDVDAILDLTRGTGSHPLVEQALVRGRPVATPNKALIREYGTVLEQLALENGVRIAYHNAIAASWPLLYTLDHPLGRDTLRSIRALLSSTCNIVLEGIEQGRSFARALADAETSGVTEQDPDLDISGWVTVQKLLILVARTCDLRYRTRDIAVRGIADIDQDLVRLAPESGYRVKLVALYVAGGASGTAAADGPAPAG